MRTLAAIGASVLALVVAYWIDDQIQLARAKPLRAGGDCGCGESEFEAEDLMRGLDLRNEHARQRHVLREMVERVAQIEADVNAHLDAHADQARAELRPDAAEDDQ